jgi:hypothetical protein
MALSVDRIESLMANEFQTLFVPIQKTFRQETVKVREGDSSTAVRLKGMTIASVNSGCNTPLQMLASEQDIRDFPPARPTHSGEISRVSHIFANLPLLRVKRPNRCGLPSLPPECRLSKSGTRASTEIVPLPRRRREANHIGASNPWTPPPTARQQI